MPKLPILVLSLSGDGRVVRTNVDFDALVVRGKGMLDPAVYRAISETAARAAGDVIEVGTGIGASAIAAALDLGPNRRVKTVDRLVGGWWGSYGSVEDNERLIRANFAAFGVADRIELYIGSSADIAETLRADDKFGMLILDADGAIDRDFALFYNRLLPGAPIVIDDYSSRGIGISPRRGGECFVDQKHRLTKLLVNHFEAEGILERDRVLKETYFGAKPTSIVDEVTFDASRLLPVYRQLIFGRGPKISALRKNTLNTMKRYAPALYLRLKKLTGRSVF